MPGADDTELLAMEDEHDKLTELRNSGTLSEEEFQAARKRLLQNE